MRRILFPVFILLLLSACAAPATPAPTIIPTEILMTPSPQATTTAQLTATPVPFFTVYGDNPIVSKGQPGAWDDRFTDPGAVIYHDGMFHMFRNGFRDFPAESQVGYVTSPDGYTWTKQGDEPVFKTKDVPYVKIAMFASSVIVEEDGTWVLYFYTWDEQTFPSCSVIGRATASNPVGPWFADPEPILHPGSVKEWDEKQVLAPQVIQTDDGYIMYYTGVDAKSKQRVGMATSPDGVTWTKYNDPATTDAPFAESDPVLFEGEGNAWDKGLAHQPRVFQTAEGWVMIYRGTQNTNGNTMALGLATSSDGIHWEKSAKNPIFVPKEIPKSNQFWFHSVLYVNSTIFLFIEGDISQTTQIYLATHEGEIIP
jgi:predicted GH43/DUF377 family glycosyl hydrolase